MCASNRLHGNYTSYGQVPARALRRHRGGIVLQVPHDDLLDAWLRRTIPARCRHFVDDVWLIVEPFAEGALFAARALFPELEVVEVDRLDVSAWAGRAAA